MTSPDIILQTLDEYLSRLILICRIRALSTPPGWRDVLYFYSALAGAVMVADFVSVLVPKEMVVERLAQFGKELVQIGEIEKKLLPAHDEPVENKVIHAVAKIHRL